ncbi:fatty acid desaturase [Sinorhizobium fredii]|uniref:hypothetical protein n=1 Tax=Rhizobium fredii TaxID=380 RepID=UPI0035173F98
MATVVRTEKRKRGIFGTLVWWVFLAFNGFMGLWIFYVIKFASEKFEQTADAATQAGTAIGGTVAAGMLLSLWLIGSVILGLIVALTRGKTVTVERLIE